MRDTLQSLKVNATALAACVALVLIGMIGSRSLAYLGFVALALLPTLAAGIIERPGYRSATVSIGSMTVATLFPLVLGAIANGGTRDLLTSVEAWVFVSCAVAGGLAIFFVMPAASVWLDDIKAASRLRGIRARQAQLERDWGTDVHS